MREDYSGNGDAWTDFPHDHSRSRAYRWGEDGLGGISDNHQRLCFALALWNGKDHILKERLFGTTGHQGNHGEDVKEIYYYLDSTPTHSYMKFLYKYPQGAYPYDKLVEESQRRSRDVGEYEILDTDAFDGDKYWDVFVEYAKDDHNPDGISIRITAYNRGPAPATLHILPQAWFRNTWIWGRNPNSPIPTMTSVSDKTIKMEHETLGVRYLHCAVSPPPGASTEFTMGAVPNRNGDLDSEEESDPEPTQEEVPAKLLFTNNETNFKRLYDAKENKSPYVKDAFHEYIVDGKKTAVNPEKKGTKAGAWYTFENVPAHGGVAVVRVKLTDEETWEKAMGTEGDAAEEVLAGAGDAEEGKYTNGVEDMDEDELFDRVMEQRKHEADDFYASLTPAPINEDLRNIQRQALAGMMWNKQFYHYVYDEWADGDPSEPPPPPGRKYIRNRGWKHLYIDDILSMPDKWEYPFFAAWDTAFHCIPLVMVDPDFAKKQLDLLTREWYMKPDGQIPAYEWNFGDVNPPVHAWAVHRVFKIERKLYGREDLDFLERVFQKLLLNFTWWVNRKDADGQGVFEGGFLGLDNIGVFNRSEPLPVGGKLRQADGTAWMAFFCLNMLNIALELAKHNRTYEDIASKFFEHFLFIADAMTYTNNDELHPLWHEKDGFYYDSISWGGPNATQIPLKSLVGLIPLFAVLTLEPSLVNKFPGFKKRMEWLIEHRPEVTDRNMASMQDRGQEERRLLALVNKERLVSILEKMLDEDEFLSDFGIRSMSKYHKNHPYVWNTGHEEFRVDYLPGESNSGLFGGNSNWRGPIWIAVNFLLIESLQRFHQYYGDTLKVECPVGSGDYMHLGAVAEEIQHRLMHIFSRDSDGRRATNGDYVKLDMSRHWRDHVQFYEYFHAETGKGLGASHQCGWTGLVAYFVHQTGLTCRLPRTPRTPRSQAQHYFDETHSVGGDEGEDDRDIHKLAEKNAVPL